MRGVFVYKKSHNPAKIAIDDRRVEADDLIRKDSVRNVVVEKYLFAKAKRIVHFQKSRAAYVVGSAVFIKVKHEDGVGLLHYIRTVSKHGGFPFCMSRVADGPKPVFRGGIIVTVWERDRVSACFERIFDGGNRVVKMLAANDEDVHNVVATGFEPVTPAM